VLSDKDIRIINQVNKIAYNSVNKQKYTQYGGENSQPIAMDLPSDVPIEIKKLAETVHGFTGINSKLGNLVDRITGEINEPDPINRKSTDINNEIMEIGQVAITLIKFLGELIEKKPNANLKKIQTDIAEITLSLEKYLE
jgi:hypothetical protein